MKKLINNRISHLLFISIMLIGIMLTSCKNGDDLNGAPVITAVRNYAAAPNDTLVTKIVPGQWIVIHGSNLKEAIQISINGKKIQYDAGLFSDGTAVLQVPASLPFNNVDPNDLNTIQYVNNSGATTFKFNVSSLPATITGNSMTAAAKVGDSIFIYGTNLFLIDKLTIAGVEISPLVKVNDGSSLGFVLPKIDTPMPWAGEIVAASGTYKFNILIVPEIYAVSNANPSKGDSIYVLGKNLNGITSLSFGGATITDFTEEPHGYYVAFTAPNQWNYSSGPVTIVSKYGTASTTYKINTQNGVTEGLLANFEWGDYFGYSWGGDISLTVNNNGGWIKTASDFDGARGTNNSMFVSFDSPVLDAGASKYAQLGNSNKTALHPRNFWMPAANLTDTASHWALQFEISVAHPWNGGTLYFRTDFAGDNYVARFEPWKVPGTNKTLAVKTKGWQTVTIPLSEFRKKGTELGNGESITQINQLIGPDGTASYDVTLKNFSASRTATGFYAAIDNIRVQKIK